MKPPFEGEAVKQFKVKLPDGTPFTVRPAYLKYWIEDGIITYAYCPNCGYLPISEFYTTGNHGNRLSCKACRLSYCCSKQWKALSKIAMRHRRIEDKKRIIDGEPHRRCTRCKKWLPFFDFLLRKRKTIEPQPLNTCKECTCDLRNISRYRGRIRAALGEDSIEYRFAKSQKRSSYLKEMCEMYGISPGGRLLPKTNGSVRDILPGMYHSTSGIYKAIRRSIKAKEKVKEGQKRRIDVAMRPMQKVQIHTGLHEAERESARHQVFL